MSQLTEILQAAVKDIAERGYSDPTVLTYWLEQLRAALRASMIPESEILKRMRRALETRFNSAIKPSMLKRRHVDISPFTVANLTPAMRQQLNKRILASADLIRLNREASIQRTLQRFAGWASSVPRIGTSESKREISKELRRSFASLPFTERRVIIDQGHKLVASVNAVVAENEEAIGAIWHSHWKQINYDFRPEHKALDGKVFLLPDTWAIREGLVKAPASRYTDSLPDQPAEAIFCRCFWQYLYSLEDLPKDLLTAKGKQAIMRKPVAA